MIRRNPPPASEEPAPSRGTELCAAAAVLSLVALGAACGIATVWVALVLLGVAAIVAGRAPAPRRSRTAALALLLALIGTSAFVAQRYARLDAYTQPASKVTTDVREVRHAPARSARGPVSHFSGTVSYTVDGVGYRADSADQRFGFFDADPSNLIVCVNPRRPISFALANAVLAPSCHGPPGQFGSTGTAAIQGPDD